MKPTKEQIEEAKIYTQRFATCDSVDSWRATSAILLAALESAQADSERLNVIEEIFSITDDHSKAWNEVKLNAAHRGWRYAADMLLRSDAARKSP